MNLSEKSITWAKAHLVRYGDSDFFPQCFEYDAINANWDSIKKHLLSTDVLKYPPNPHQIMYVPKANDTFRVAHRLDPIDSIVYSALVYEIAEEVEKLRVIVGDKSIYSYRISLNDQGDLFDKTSKWSDFIDRESELIDNYQTGYVITADVTDFYGQIYTHRVSNLIEEIMPNGRKELSKAIEDLLLSLNDGTSRGIPVGPQASIVIAELIMADIDRYLVKFDCEYIRYVDDYRIFTRSKKEAIKILCNMTEYLHKTHRLVFSSSKTRTWTVQEYQEKRLEFKIEESRLMNKRLDETFERIRDEILDSIDDYGLVLDFDVDHETVYRKTFEEVYGKGMINIIGEDTHFLFSKFFTEQRDYSMLRGVLKKARILRVKSILSDVINNLPDLIPVYREAIHYLISVLKPGDIASLNVVRMMLDTDFAILPYVNMWTVELLLSKNYWKSADESEMRKILSQRDTFLVRAQADDVSGIRNIRESIKSYDPWAKRAALHAASILPKSERRAWLNHVTTSANILEQAVIKHSISL